MRRAVIALLAFVGALACRAPAADLARYTLEHDGKTRSYYLYVPDTVTDKPAPLVVLLHGSFRNGERITQLWKSRADQDGLVLLAPNSYQSQGWRLSDDSPSFIQAVLQSAVAKAPINGRRMYLFGHSAGAVFALNLAMLESELFAATAVHAGAWRSDDEYLIVPFGKRKIPLAIIIGDRDEFFRLSSVRKTEAALLSASFPIEVTVLTGHDHKFDFGTAPDIIARATEFLMKTELPQRPKFTPYSTDPP